MPIYQYECTSCGYQFEKIFSINEKSGKTDCIKCANTSFKIPAVFVPRIFKKRVFSDGTSTPEFVATPKQEENWMKSQKITYDPPSKDQKNKVKKERQVKSKTIMEEAFKKAVDKCEQGFKFDKPLEQRNIKSSLRFKV